MLACITSRDVIGGITEKVLSATFLLSSHLLVFSKQLVLSCLQLLNSLKILRLLTKEIISLELPLSPFFLVFKHK